MAKGKLITATEKTLVSHICLEHPDWYAKQVLQELHGRLGYIKDKEGRYWPGISAVQKIMTDIEKRKGKFEDEGAPQDKPWSMATLDNHPIPAEAIPYVLKAWVYYQEMKWQTWPFSIREAKWVARLYRVTEEIQPLVLIAYSYSRLERAAELAGVQPDTKNLDLDLYELLTRESLTLERREMISRRSPVVPHGLKAIEYGTMKWVTENNSEKYDKDK